MWLNEIANILKKSRINEAKMDDATRTEVLIYLSKVHREQFDIRQKVEWKVLFTAISVCGFAIVGVYKAPSPHPIALLLVPIFYWVFSRSLYRWLLRVHMNHLVSKNAAHRAENELYRMVGVESAELFQKTTYCEAKRRFWGDNGPFIFVASERYFYLKAQRAVLVVVFVASFLYVMAELINKTSSRLVWLERSASEVVMRFGQSVPNERGKSTLEQIQKSKEN